MAEVVTPKGKLDLSAVADLHTALGSLSGRDVVVDLSEVTQLGALCMQAIVSASKSAEADGTSFEVRGASEQVAAQVATMGHPVPPFSELSSPPSSEVPA